MTIQNKPFILTVGKDDMKIAKEINRCLKESQDHYNVLLHIIEQGLLPADEVCRLWADSLNIAWIDLNATLFQPKIVASLPKELAKKLSAIPVYQMGGAVTVAMVDPKNSEQLQKIEAALKQKVSPVFALEEDISDVIEVQYQSVDFLENLAEDSSMRIPAKKIISKDDLHKIAGEKAVVDFARSLLLLAIKQNASDIHIEPF